MLSCFAMRVSVRRLSCSLLITGRSRRSVQSSPVAFLPFACRLSRSIAVCGQPASTSLAASLEEKMELSPEQLRDYEEQGFLLVQGLIDASIIASLNGEVDRLLHAALGRTAHDDIYDFEETHSETEPRVRRIKSPHEHSIAFQELMRHPGILAICQQLLRCVDLRRGDFKLNLKSERYGSAVQWHQDWAFYPHTNEDLLAVGIFLDDVTSENGPPLMMPRSHRGPLYPHHSNGEAEGSTFVGGINVAETGLDFANDAVPLTGAAGSVTFHHTRLLHGSDINVSGTTRRIAFLEVGAADAWPLAGVGNFKGLEDFFTTRMLCGRPTLWPRMEAVPVCMPMPKPNDPRFLGSIYASQQLLDNPFFARITDK